MPKPPLHAEMTTLTCHRKLADTYCGSPAAWHLSWYDPAQPLAEWANSLACQDHRDDAERRGWTIGWRHRVLPACTLPGSRLRIADAGDDDDGFPLTFCYHPWDIDAAVLEGSAAMQEAR